MARPTTRRFTGTLAFAGLAAAAVALTALVPMQGYTVHILVQTATFAIAVFGLTIVLGLAGMRTRGVNLAIVTLGFSIAIEAVVFGNQRYTGGISGLNVGALKFLGIGIDANPALKPLSELEPPVIDPSTLNGPETVQLMQDAGLL